MDRIQIDYLLECCVILNDFAFLSFFLCQFQIPYLADSFCHLGRVSMELCDQFARYFESQLIYL